MSRAVSPCSSRFSSNSIGLQVVRGRRIGGWFVSSVVGASFGLQ